MKIFFILLLIFPIFSAQAEEWNVGDVTTEAVIVVDLTEDFGTKESLIANLKARGNEILDVDHEERFIKIRSDGLLEIERRREWVLCNTAEKCVEIDLKDFHPADPNGIGVVATELIFQMSTTDPSKVGEVWELMALETLEKTINKNGSMRVLQKENKKRRWTLGSR